ncbi:hypothetical protein [Mangrovibacterium diazotrophicum]|uniref:ATP-grasp domain-containing protein n=1 Tax=Mangrovibacterium diazotrophicum TaxID=1261403 RepID=A0A419W3E5_9BACT|nr:hypothetical protein [Mangrovibacterium diazotrophicum]RKD89959.1 hypothetical protein BC643_0293 [Mangrovibacterium diazotrophicum]
MVFLPQKVISQPTRIFHFNPTCEIAIANGSPYFVPTALLCEFEADLATVMSVLASQNDLVVCREIPSSRTIEEWKKWNLMNGKFVTLESLTEHTTAHNSGSFDLQSWGKSPAEANLFKFLNSSHWDDNLKQLFERKTSTDFLNCFLERDDLPAEIDRSLNQLVICKEAEIEHLLKRQSPIVLKAPLSSSGRGLLVLRKNELNNANRQWIKGNLDQQGYLVASSWLNKKLDLSFQFESDGNGGISYLGHSVFMTNSNGQYAGHYLNFKLRNKLPIDEKVLTLISEKLGEELTQSTYSTIYKGIIGIDTLVYLDEDNKLKIHACIEINPRYTMGFLSQQIEQKIHPESYGHYKIFFDPKGGFQAFAEAEKKINPPTFADGFIRKGFFNLTPADKNCKFGAYVELF